MPPPPPPPPPAAEDEGESRDWAEMPTDALAAVFARLDVSDLLTGAGVACRAWRRLSATDPSLWRRVDMSHHSDLMDDEDVEAMACKAVERAAGTMEAFSADTFVSDDLLLFISERASFLKKLQLSMCFNVSNEGLAEALKGFPQLEELDITFCSLYGDVCESVGKACSQLKCFRLNERWTFESAYQPCTGLEDDTEALGIASSMPELQTLQLIGNVLTNDGLISILDHCPRLKSLDIRQCYNIKMDDALKAKCARITNLKLPHDSISDFTYRAYITNSFTHSGSDFEVDMYDDDLLDVVTEDDEAEFDDMDDYDDAELTLLAWTMVILIISGENLIRAGSPSGHLEVVSWSGVLRLWKPPDVYVSFYFLPPIPRSGCNQLSMNFAVLLCCFRDYAICCAPFSLGRSKFLASTPSLKCRFFNAPVWFWFRLGLIYTCYVQ